jgi:pimeloyl-ACP methyl ester carboxylesterase
MTRKIIFILTILTTLTVQAKHKVYLIHGFAGLGIEMQKISNYLKKAGYECEIFTYPSLSKDIDSVAHKLYNDILNDKPDTVSFVTHSMGALVARSIYHYLRPTQKFPVIHRMVMIAPPNKGTPVADFFVHSRLISSLAGPNIRNLTTDERTGAIKYPIPDCEVGIILGIAPFKTGFNLFLEENNDGLVLPKHAKLGIEKDIAFLKASHTAILFRNQTSKLTLRFLKKGYFTPRYTVKTEVTTLQ